MGGGAKEAGCMCVHRTQARWTNQAVSNQASNRNVNMRLDELIFDGFTV